MSKRRAHRNTPWLTITIVLMTGAMMLPGWAQEGGPAAVAKIDVGSSTPVITSPSLTALKIPFTITCSMPDVEETCDVFVRLHIRPAGSTWSALPSLLSGFSLKFPVTIPNTRFVEYYLEVTDRKTGAQVFFPQDGQEAPLRFYVQPAQATTTLESLAFSSHRQPDFAFRLPWGSEPGSVGLIPGNESSTIGPQALDVDADGNIFVLDQLNDRVQVFNRLGVLTNSIPLTLGPMGDIVLSNDGSLYVLDVVPEGPGSHPVVHHVRPAAIPFSEPSIATVETPEWEPAHLRFENGVLWVYGTPSDAWRPLLGEGLDALPKLQMGMPSAVGELLRRVHQWERVDVAPARAGVGPRLSILAPPDRRLGTLNLV